MHIYIYLEIPWIEKGSLSCSRLFLVESCGVQLKNLEDAGCVQDRQTAEAVLNPELPKGLN